MNPSTHRQEPGQVYVVMGVAGSGKTTVGQALANALDAPFYDGDDFHPPENVAKMANGIPLNDADRIPWLARLHDLLVNYVVRGETAVLACSALKKKYRTQLRGEHSSIRFIFLDGGFDLIQRRLSKRQDHYMKPQMLRSQFDALERPSASEALIVQIDQPIEEIVRQIVQAVQQ